MQRRCRRLHPYQRKPAGPEQQTPTLPPSKQIETYRELKPVHDRYKALRDKEKFLRGFESEAILFEAAAREIKKTGITKLPSSEKLKK